MRLRVLLLCLFACVLAWVVLPLGASSGQSLSRIQGQIDETEGAIGRKRGTERVLASDIAAYTSRINALQGRISSLHRREVAIQTDLDEKTAELERVQSALRSERARLTRLRARLAVARRALARRLVELYTSDQPDLVDVVLSADGFADLLERGEFLRRISDADRKILAIVREAKADAEATEARLVVLQKRRQEIAAAVMRQRDAVRSVREDLVGTRVGYQRTRQDKYNALAKTREDRHHLEGELLVLRSKQQEITARLARASSGSSLTAGPVRPGSGGMIWPVNGPITSPFCEARSWESCHPGIDIGVPAGTPIRAAQSGRVALVQGEASSGGYGNFICVQHSGALSTCYAHLSSFGASSGQSVSQGQVIGSVGCTGRCFGDHLHFEVRINGAVTNPMNYL
jgi:murein DD-endopeptidase MepM/ murein hydrolase activator NlpD